MTAIEYMAILILLTKYKIGNLYTLIIDLANYKPLYYIFDYSVLNLFNKFQQVKLKYNNI